MPLLLPPALCLLLFVTLACHSTGQPGTWERKGQEILRQVQEHFYDAARADAWAREHAQYTQGIRDDAEFVTRTKAALAKLQASHTGYYTPTDPEYFGLRSIFGLGPPGSVAEVDSLGMDVRADGFVRVVFAAGPAAQAGLRRGDRLVSADGQPFHPVLSVRGKAGRPVTLLVQRRREEPPVPLTVVPHKVEPKQEWLEAQRQGARVIQVQGKKVAYMSFYSCAGEEHAQVLQEAIVQQFAAADALILDFRDGWGGCNPTLVNLFNHAPPVLTRVGRDGKPQPFDAQWRKPLVLLINEGSRSGKEVVAYAVKKHKLGTLVGTRTAGAVLGGRVFPLADNSLLYLAVMDIRVDGDRLEGTGVAPDVEVKDLLSFANGADPQLDKALEVAAR